MCIYTGQTVKWNRQEIVASSLFLNSERIPSLLNNHYYWVELPAGNYRLSTSRPLGVNHFQKPKYLDFTVEAGQSYFIKYDEENMATRRSVSGALMLMPDQTGRSEIAFTERKSSSYNFVAQDEQRGKVRHSAQKLKAEKYDPENRCSVGEAIQIMESTDLVRYSGLLWTVLNS